MPTEKLSEHTIWWVYCAYRNGFLGNGFHNILCITMFSVMTANFIRTVNFLLVSKFNTSCQSCLWLVKTTP